MNKRKAEATKYADPSKGAYTPLVRYIQYVTHEAFIAGWKGCERYSASHDQDYLDMIVGLSAEEECGPFNPGKALSIEE